MVMKWLKRLFCKPKSPRNLDEAVAALEHILSPKIKKLSQERSEVRFILTTHRTLGMGIRNNWGLWNKKSKLHKWFNTMGIWHADDMSAIIFSTYYRKVHNLPIKLNEQILNYVKYWKIQESSTRHGRPN